MSPPSAGCPVCAAPLRAGLAAWHARCPACGYEGSDLQSSINEVAAHAGLDETVRDTGLRSLREHNFRALLDRVAALQPGRKWLDVGAAHGWFVQQAQARGIDITGVEPDEQVCARAQRAGITLRPGYFPQALEQHERFDVIVFNDVFEHIPDAAATLRACQGRLNADGLLVLNLPSSRGVFYRTSKALWRLGARGFFERLWQKGLPSPHLHYFHADNLARLGEQHGFNAVEAFHLPSVRLEGLWPRIAYVRDGRNWTAPVVWLGVVLAYPLLALLPADIDVVVFRRLGSAPSAC